MKYPDDFINKIICGDCNDVMSHIPDNSIDMIITDPPYPKEYDYLYKILFKHGARILKSRGNLISLCGHYQLPFVLDVGREHLRFWWILWMKQTKINRLIGKGVTVQGKPAVWFLKDRRRDFREYKFPFDTVEAKLSKDREAKKYHKWGQAVNWFEHYIGELTKQDEIVLDPFIGSGTTAIACIKLKRNYIGIDISNEYCEIARERINDPI